MTLAVLFASGCAAASPDTSPANATRNTPTATEGTGRAADSPAASSATGAVTTTSEVQQAQRSGKPRQSDVPSGDVPAAIKLAFGAQVEAVTQFKPYHLLGDFNGDGIQDLFAIVRLRAPKSELPKDVVVSNPFSGGDEVRERKDSSADARARPVLAFAVIHGSQSEGWGTATPLAKFLLLDAKSPVLALNDARLKPPSVASDAANLVELLPIIKQRGRVESFGVELTSIKGDAVIAGTEAVDSLVYFDGTKYLWQESTDEP